MRKLAVFSLTLLGLFDSAYLWWAYTSPRRPLVCFGGGCDVARASRFAHFLGLPLPFFGFAMYAVLALLVFAEPLISTALARRIRLSVGIISGVGVLASAYLTWVEAFVLHAWCFWCVVSAICVTGIFAFALLDLLHPPLERDFVRTRQLLAVFLVAVVAGAPAFWLLSRREELPPTPAISAAALAERLVRPESYVYGNPNGALTVVEFADFECPYCGRAELAAELARRKFAGQIRFVFRHYPIDSIHPQAEKAAEASECAAEQGKFWQAVGKLYEYQNDLSEPALRRYAAELGLEQRRFDECLASGRMAARVRRDKDDGLAVGVRATPTFFIAGKKFEGPLEPAQLAQFIERELAVSRAAVAQADGTPSDARKAKEGTPGRPPTKPPRPAAPPPAGSSTEPGHTDSSLAIPNAGGAFAQFSNPTLGCSEAETKKQQPTLIRTAEARQLFEAGHRAVFIDVRPAKEFANGRIPHAISLPVDDLERRWDTLPKDRTVVFYESGLSPGDVCASARAAGRLLLAHGFPQDHVKVYQDGLAGWKEANLPLER